MTVEVTEIGNAIENVTETKKKNENVTRPIFLSTFANVNKNKNNDIIEQSFQWPSLRTYQSPQLNFNMVSEKEDDMEWINVEPPINKTISAHTNKKKKQKKNRPQRNSPTEETNPQTTIENLISENVRLRRIIKRYTRRIKTLKLRFQKYARRMPAKRTNKKNNKKMLQKMMNENKLHPVAKAMINLQLHTPNAPYTEEERNISKQLYYYSASALRGLRKAGCNFPGERTIRRWHEEYNMMPGFCEFIFHKLREKISKIPAEERVCALKWDEMAIKSYEEYSFKLDEIEGLVDLGPLGRKHESAKHVFVFCLDSLNARYPWRQPLAYFLPGTGMKADDIIFLLKECLDRLVETGADVQLVTCDQGTSNQSAYTQLGVHSDNPFFIHNGKKYYASFDFPHLVKRLASLLRKHKYLYRDGKIIASFHDFEETWSIDDANKGGSNLLSHITEAHIRPNNFEKMNVKRAFQLFSHTFAAAIRTAGHGKVLETNTWDATSEFTEYLNKVIDACNSYSLKMTHGGKRPLSSKNPDIEILLRDFVEWCSKWSLSSNKITKIPCLRGFSLTVQAILEVFEQLSTRFENFELATGLCNQDSVEHLFSKLRGRGGFNPNPTARMIRLALRHIISTGYIPITDKGNVQCEEAESLINSPSDIVKTLEESLNTNHTIIEYDANFEDELFIEDVQMLEEYDKVGNAENVEPLNIYDENAIAYFAGYIVRQTVAKSKCDNCRNYMMKTPMDNATENEMYIEFREYPNADEDAPTVTKLIRPTDLFTKVVQTQLEVFNRTWQCYWASKQIMDKIMNECVTETNEKHSGWLDKNNVCYNHRLQALRHMIKVKLYSRTRYNNRATKRGNSKRKMSNLLNK